MNTRKFLVNVGTKCSMVDVTTETMGIARSCGTIKSFLQVRDQVRDNVDLLVALLEFVTDVLKDFYS